MYNYIDKPDFSMNGLVARVNRLLGRPERIRVRWAMGLGRGLMPLPRSRASALRLARFA